MPKARGPHERVFVRGVEDLDFETWDGIRRCRVDSDTRMVERRIKPQPQQAANDERREEQRRQYRRNQVFGLLIVVAVILAWWLFHTNPRWIFPPGWWRP